MMTNCNIIFVGMESSLNAERLIELNTTTYSRCNLTDHTFQIGLEYGSEDYESAENAYISFHFIFSFSFHFGRVALQ